MSLRAGSFPRPLMAVLGAALWLAILGRPGRGSGREPGRHGG